MGRSDDHRAQDEAYTELARFIADRVREAKAEAWDEGAQTALDYAVRNPDGITLRLDTHRNPYIRQEADNGRD